MDIIDTIKEQIESNPILLYMKGTPNAPQCGFSARTVQALIACGQRFAYVNILEHPEMAGLEESIARTLAEPEQVVQSFSDTQARLYYRFYCATMVGDKYLCVVVKVTTADAFVLTAYLTDRIKRG